jgi:hypothetical protein
MNAYRSQVREAIEIARMTARLAEAEKVSGFMLTNYLTTPRWGHVFISHLMKLPVRQRPHRLKLMVTILRAPSSPEGSWNREAVR